MKKIIAVMLSVIVFAGALSACSNKNELTTIRLNEVTHSVFYAPLYAALNLGFFGDEGLEVELTNGGGADKVMTAVLANQADIGLAGPEACIYVLNEGREDYPIVFAQLTKRDGSFLVGRTDEDFKWSNLMGKTIIGGRKGGVPEMTLEYVMRQNGVVPQDDAIVDTSVQFNMMAGAFTGGNGDYVTLFEPTATEVEAAGKGYILTSIGLESGEIPYTAFFASKSYISKNEKVIQSFTNAIAKGQKWVMGNSADEIAKAIADQFPDTDVKVLAKVAQRYKDIDAWNDTPVMKQEALERLETVMETAGELDKWVDFDVLVDNSFAEQSSSNK
ncbi:MAG: ABC transporter substrate-binding protein [Clostridiaceae bacterium]|nr:ABC transporter substrate-binding protein [Clostridiaceae bacterium]